MTIEHIIAAAAVLALALIDSLPDLIGMLP
jgi:hypothetical protein